MHFDGCARQLMDMDMWIHVDGGRRMWMHVKCYGWMWMFVDRCWMHVDACGWMRTHVNGSGWV